MAKKTKKKIKKSILFRSFSLLFLIVSIIALFLLYRLNILPQLYFILLTIFLSLLNLVFYFLVSSKNWKKRMSGVFLTILFIIFLGVGIFYESVTLGFFVNAFQSRERVENYQVLVLNSSNYGSLKEFKNGKIGVPAANFSEGARMLQNEIKKKTTLTLEEMDNTSLVDSLLQKDLRVIVMEEAQKELFMELNDDFKNEVKVLETISVTVQNQIKKRESLIMKKPFHVYISGSDDYGVINQVSRSDVNMILTVNPLTHQVLITSIPRDYYVSLYGINAYDKITHASLYGIDTSLKTLEGLLDIEIPYYLKINFSSLVGLVDVLGGVDVVNDEAFVANYYDEPTGEWINYSFLAGLNHLNGKQALAFSRERKSFAQGDRARMIHQQMVLTALMEKIVNPAILTNYTKILNALNGSFDTNLNYEDILLFLQKQLSTNPSWSIETNYLEGTDAQEWVYSIKSAPSYVMKQSDESVSNAKEKMKMVYNATS